ncbi:MAG: methyltransferase domain-containing protein [Novipirellula sp. JB048]
MTQVNHGAESDGDAASRSSGPPSTEAPERSRATSVSAGVSTSVSTGGLLDGLLGRLRFERDLQPELMDDPALPRAEHELALAGLARLNRFSGVAGVMYRRLRGLARDRSRPLRVLDVASGAGDVPVHWARRAKREGIEMQITALDISSVAIAAQQQRAAQAEVAIRSEQWDCLNQPLPSGFDVVTCSLFMHHLDEAQATFLLRSMYAATDRAVVVCDLERSRLNLGLVGLAAHLLSRSRVVHTDAVLSVQGAYRRAEFRRLAEAALGIPVMMRGAFPCRFIASFHKPATTDRAGVTR